MLGLLVLSATLLQTGCASLSKDECRYADWYDIGYRDGRQGFPGDRLVTHAKACGEHGVAPDRTRYLDGRAAGLGAYCTAQNGFAVGNSGSRYYGVCDDDPDNGFHATYALGQALYRARYRLNQIDHELGSVDGVIADKESSDKERAVAVLRRIELTRDRVIAARQLEELEYQAQSI